MGSETSGNPNPVNDIAALGKATQFGAEKGADPVVAQAASVEAQRINTSVRSELRYLVSQPINNDPAEVDAELKRLRADGEGRTTVGRMIASRLVERLIKKADPHLASTLLDNMEGKLSQEIVLPPASKAPPHATTLEEAAALYKEHMPR